MDVDVAVMVGAIAVVGVAFFLVWFYNRFTKKETEMPDPNPNPAPQNTDPLAVDPATGNPAPAGGNQLRPDPVLGTGRRHDPAIEPEVSDRMPSWAFGLWTAGLAAVAVMLITAGTLLWIGYTADQKERVRNTTKITAVAKPKPRPKSKAAAGPQQALKKGPGANFAKPGPTTFVLVTRGDSAKERGGLYCLRSESPPTVLDDGRVLFNK